MDVVINTSHGNFYVSVLTWLDTDLDCGLDLVQQ